MPMYHRIFAALIAAIAIVIAAHGEGRVPKQQPEEKSKTDPPGVPLEARLIAKQDTYVLNLGGKTQEEFRKLLKEPLPPAPAVGLELQFRNCGGKDLTFLVGGFAPDIPLLLKLDGPGAVNIALPAHHVRLRGMPPQQVTLAPGKTHTLAIKSLMTSRLNRDGTASYWTQPGDYTLIATYKTAVSPVPKGAKDNGKGFGPVTVTSAPVKLKVVEKKGETRARQLIPDRASAGRRFADAAKKVEKRTAELAGTWKVVSIERDGKEMGANFKGAKWVFTDTTLAARFFGEGEAKFAYKTAKVDKVRSIDLEVVESPRDGGPRKRTYVGIYSVEGDNLKICYAAGGKQRPKEFAAKAGSGSTLVVLKR
jgi:uncharacterized protein (TIGR03067 family)